MKKISLNGKWRMTGAGFDTVGNIPGSLFSFLLENKLIDDPFYRDNEFAALELTKNDYTFTREFEFSGGDDEYTLVFEGIDTLASVYLNGKQIASTSDMHMRYEIPVTNVLVRGKNELRVEIFSVRDYITRRSEDLELHRYWIHALRGHAYVRKAACMFGWDWGPFLPDMGIWRPVYLLCHDSARITDLRITQRHTDGRVYITPTASTDKAAELRITLTAPSGECTELENGVEYEVSSPELWWPRGLGEQPLYTVCAQVVKDGEILDRSERRIGLRTLTLAREKDRYGESFAHECNGVKFFAMGADYIPEDNIFSRINEQRTRGLIKRCADANFNAIRVWGGGYYPDDYFFDACDEYGIVVFMDLMFACSYYMPDEQMLNDIKCEVRQNLTRLRHHASLAIISGNNEIEACTYTHTDPTSEKCRPVQIELFEHIIFDITKEVCPEIPYIPTSPVTCGHFIDPQNENYGDQHYWEVWHSNKPFTEYRKKFFRYLSEFGFQSFPSYKTVEQFTLPEDRNVFSRVMEMHQRNAGANGKIVNYISQTYLYPTDFSTLLYTSQLLQAEAMKYAVEHLRRHRGRCMGTLYWQLNDIWPVASWSSIDYYGRLKALHYYAKRFYAPVMIGCEEIGETTTRPVVVMQPDIYDYETRASLCVTNETKNEVRGTVKSYLRSADSKIIAEYTDELTVAPLSSVTLCERDFEKTDVRNNYYSYELWVDGGIVSSGSVLFTAPKHFCFIDPKLSYEINGDVITIKSSAYAKSVEIDSPDSDLILEDNYFDMNAGERKIKILEGCPKTLTLRSVFDIK